MRSLVFFRGYWSAFLRQRYRFATMLSLNLRHSMAAHVAPGRPGVVATGAAEQMIVSPPSRTGITRATSNSMAARWDRRPKNSGSS